MAIYLSPTTKPFFRDQTTFGCMLNIVRPIGKQKEALREGCKWILDNGQFNDNWNWALWWHWLNMLLPYSENCLGICIPDKLRDWFMTIHFFRVFNDIPREMGYPVALVTQDGATKNDIPWNSIDCLFIGGSHYHKRGKEAEILISEAKRRGKWVHIGRVQSGSTMITHWPDADSFDGTTLARHPEQQFKSISQGIKAINRGSIPFNLKLI